MPHHVTAQIEKVRAFGQAESLPILTEPSWPDDKYHGWEMTAIAARILHAKGAYRTPRGGAGFTYYVYTAVRMAKDDGGMS